MFPSLHNMEIQHSFCVLRIGLRTQIDLKSKGELGKAQINYHLLSRGVMMMMIISIKNNYNNDNNINNSNNGNNNKNRLLTIDAFLRQCDVERRQLLL